MLNPILPAHVDNVCPGHQAALWLAIPVLLAKLAIAFNCIAFGRLVAQSADGIPLDTYPPAAAATVLALFAVWGVSQLLLCLLGVLVLVRYRSMLPFLYLMFAAEFLARMAVLTLRPIAHVPGTPSLNPTNLILLALVLAGLVLSLNRGSTVPRWPD